MNNNKSRARRSERRRNKENGEIERRKDDCHANGSYVVVSSLLADYWYIKTNQRCWRSASTADVLQMCRPIAVGATRFLCLNFPSQKATTDVVLHRPSLRFFNHRYWCKPSETSLPACLPCLFLLLALPIIMISLHFCQQLAITHSSNACPPLAGPSRYTRLTN